VKRWLAPAVGVLLAACEPWQQLLDDALDAGRGGGGGTAGGFAGGTSGGAAGGTSGGAAGGTSGGRAGGSAGGAAGGTAGGAAPWDGGRCESADAGSVAWTWQPPGAISFRGLVADDPYFYVATKLLGTSTVKLLAVRGDGGTVASADLQQMIIPGGFPQLDARDGLVAVIRDTNDGGSRLDVLQAPALTPMRGEFLDAGWGLNVSLVRRGLRLDVAGSDFVAGQLIGKFLPVDAGGFTTLGLCSETSSSAPFISTDARSAGPDGGEVLLVALSFAAGQQCSPHLPAPAPDGGGWAFAHVTTGSVQLSPAVMFEAPSAFSSHARITSGPGLQLATLPSSAAASRLVRVSSNLTATQLALVDLLEPTNMYPVPVATCPFVQDAFVALNVNGAQVRINGAAYALQPGSPDIAVARIRPNGTVVWLTQLEAPGDQRAYGIAWADGMLVVYGACNGTTTSAYCPAAPGTFLVGIRP